MEENENSENADKDWCIITQDSQLANVYRINSTEQSEINTMAQDKLVKEFSEMGIAGINIFVLGTPQCGKSLTIASLLGIPSDWIASSSLGTSAENWERYFAPIPSYETSLSNGVFNSDETHVSFKISQHVSVYRIILRDVVIRVVEATVPKESLLRPDDPIFSLSLNSEDSTIFTENTSASKWLSEIRDACKRLFIELPIPFTDFIKRQIEMKQAAEQEKESTGWKPLVHRDIVTESDKRTLLEGERSNGPFHLVLYVSELMGTHWRLLMNRMANFQPQNRGNVTSSATSSTSKLNLQSTQCSADDASISSSPSSSSTTSSLSPMSSSSILLPQPTIISKPQLLSALHISTQIANNLFLDHISLLLLLLGGRILRTNTMVVFTHAGCACIPGGCSSQFEERRRRCEEDVQYMIKRWNWLGHRYHLPINSSDSNEDFGSSAKKNKKALQQSSNTRRIWNDSDVGGLNEGINVKIHLKWIEESTEPQEKSASASSSASQTLTQNASTTASPNSTPTLPSKQWRLLLNVTRRKHVPIIVPPVQLGFVMVEHSNPFLPRSISVEEALKLCNTRLPAAVDRSDSNLLSAPLRNSYSSTLQNSFSSSPSSSSSILSMSSSPSFSSQIEFSQVEMVELQDSSEKSLTNFISHSISEPSQLREPLEPMASVRQTSDSVNEKYTKGVSNAEKDSTVIQPFKITQPSHHSHHLSQAVSLPHVISQDSDEQQTTQKPSKTHSNTTTFDDSSSLSEPSLLAISIPRLNELFDSPWANELWTVAFECIDDLHSIPFLRTQSDPQRLQMLDSLIGEDSSSSQQMMSNDLSSKQPKSSSSSSSSSVSLRRRKMMQHMEPKRTAVYRFARRLSLSLRAFAATVGGLVTFGAGSVLGKVMFGAFGLKALAVGLVLSCVSALAIFLGLKQSAAVPQMAAVLGIPVEVAAIANFPFGLLNRNDAQQQQQQQPSRQTRRAAEEEEEGRAGGTRSLPSFFGKSQKQSTSSVSSTPVASPQRAALAPHPIAYISNRPANAPLPTLPGSGKFAKEEGNFNSSSSAPSFSFSSRPSSLSGSQPSSSSSSYSSNPSFLSLPDDASSTHPSVILVGPPFVGKTAVGKQLAARLGLPFLCVASLTEQRMGHPISAIRLAAGEGGLIRALSDDVKSVISSVVKGELRCVAEFPAELPSVGREAMIGLMPQPFEASVVYLKGERESLMKRMQLQMNEEKQEKDVEKTENSKNEKDIQASSSSMLSFPTIPSLHRHMISSSPSSRRMLDQILHNCDPFFQSISHLVVDTSSRSVNDVTFYVSESLAKFRQLSNMRFIKQTKR
ncbi:uncharacterized protein MONOS_3166 [Monocercomonoides exilis]|uniref:uncharacterized protein n=1 Tax=Monocercomonoides exilis TaxID=2049356 RepID=UPI0035598C41|nr:hypothetical protein MONOS_3166 [Monocercomonoides exilis]|eukprot:MONOS_3166.1-p1 / transcript=MONOS_3166.1 / gene=MONOS_3166 / organism=Monocercomonoides_exilis_PA203 / gene_product=unspecified product / transcript_product=unspecified product / location=Mono_scaffold00072:71066-75072(+) / protein_length=1312 / sequence_SO=supercontig / SO=protein_coding / is_pseudo=false